jgi:hypothetical protein
MLSERVLALIRSAKKPPKSEKEAPAAKGIGLVKGQAKSGTKRKSA